MTMKRFLGAFLGVAILASCAGERKNLKDQSEPHVKMAISLMNEGNYTEALKELFEAEKIYPEYPLVQYNLGLAFWLKRDLQAAREHFEKAIALDPHYSEAYNNLGVVYMDLQRWDDAIKCFTHALSDILYSTPENSWTNLGDAYIGKRNYPKAIECYKKSIELASANPRIYQVYKKLGRACFLSGKYPDAVDFLEKSRRLNPRDAETHLFLGDAYVRSGGKNKAIEEYREAVRLDPAGPLGEKAKRYLRLQQ